jgi:hypothetical protein
MLFIFATVNAVNVARQDHGEAEEVHNQGDFLTFAAVFKHSGF